MNEHDDSLTGPPPILSAPIIAPPANPSWHYARRFLACNPFYLASAALLLFGCYRVSVDPFFIRREMAQLDFNFASLQAYELLLVATAIFLGFRRIRYDSLLLAGLENLFIFVPFIFISEAAWIEPRMLWVLCATGALLAGIRSGALKRYLIEFNAPGRLLRIGAVLLTLNAALPAVYRILNGTKAGCKPDWGAAYYTNRWVWLLVLPASLALVNAVPMTRKSPASRQAWMPAGLFSLWIAATLVHVYCLDYVYDFDLNRELAAPVFWVLCWSVFLRMRAIFAPEEFLKNALMLPPIFAALTAMSANGNMVYLALTILNAAIYIALWLSQRNSGFVRYLLFASVVMLFAGLPHGTPAMGGAIALPDVSPGKWLWIGTASCLVYAAALSRNPKLGMLGAGAAAISIFVLGGSDASAAHWALQTALACVLAHSLRWEGGNESKASTVRIILGLLWLAHSFVWLHSGGWAWMCCLPSGGVLSACLVTRISRGRWDYPSIPSAAIAVFLSGPGDALMGALHTTPAGVLLVGGSFALFVAGTIAALTKSRWHPETAADNESKA